MAQRLDFEQVDVFTREKFRGNPLAVFPDAAGLSKVLMQDIAKEMNLSETTFVTPSERSDCAARVYIFTPGLEMPFAGHPTVGTAWVLAKLGRLPHGVSRVQLHENVGPVPVRLVGDPQDPSEIFLTAPPLEFGRIFENRGDFALALSLQPSDLWPDAPVQLIGAPVPFLYVCLRTPAQVDAVALNAPVIMRLLSGCDASGVFVCAPDGAPRQVYSRMLGLDQIGIVEDPATGAASAPLGAYLIRYQVAGVAYAGPEPIKIISQQGTKMGRRSFVSILVEREGEQIRRIEVGGSVVPVLRGRLEL